MYRAEVLYPLDILGSSGETLVPLDSIVKECRGRAGKTEYLGTKCVVLVEFDDCALLDTFFNRVEKLFTSYTDEKHASLTLDNSPLLKPIAGAPFHIELRRVTVGTVGSRSDRG